MARPALVSLKKRAAPDISMGRGASVMAFERQTDQRPARLPQTVALPMFSLARLPVRKMVSIADK